jgi:hypothetical protein
MRVVTTAQREPIGKAVFLARIDDEQIEHSLVEKEATERVVATCPPKSQKAAWNVRPPSVGKRRR